MCVDSSSVSSCYIEITTKIPAHTLLCQPVSEDRDLNRLSPSYVLILIV